MSFYSSEVLFDGERPVEATSKSFVLEEQWRRQKEARAKRVSRAQRMLRSRTVSIHTWTEMVVLLLGREKKRQCPTMRLAQRRQPRVDVVVWAYTPAYPRYHPVYIRAIHLEIPSIHQIPHSNRSVVDSGWRFGGQFFEVVVIHSVEDCGSENVFQFRDQTALNR